LISNFTFSFAHLRLSGGSDHERQPLVFTTGDMAMPQTPQFASATLPRSNEEPGITHEEDVPSDSEE